jgi:hypothetical protein
VHIKVEDTSDGEGGGGEERTGGEGDGEGEKEEEEEEEEEKEEEEVPRDLLAHAPGAGPKCRSQEVRPESLSSGARSKPGSPRARLRAPHRIADNANLDNDVQEREEEETSLVPDLAKRGGAGHIGSSRLIGVSWDKKAGKWKAQYNDKHLGYYTMEEAAARAYGKYLEDGIDPVKRRGASTSQFKGVSWNTCRGKWRAKCKGTDLGTHATEGEAARAYSKYLEDGIDPVEHRGASTSQFTGVSWDKNLLKWRVQCKGKHLGLHATEEAAARAYSKYLQDDIDIVKHRGASTSLFTGVHWDKNSSKWRAKYKGKTLSRHATEGAAARAYNAEAERHGVALNVIPPAGAAGAGAWPDAGSGAGPKRATLMTPAAPTTSKNTKRAVPMTPAAAAPSKQMKL